MLEAQPPIRRISPPFVQKPVDPRALSMLLTRGKATEFPGAGRQSQLEAPGTNRVHSGPLRVHLVLAYLLCQKADRFTRPGPSVRRLDGMPRPVQPLKPVSGSSSLRGTISALCGRARKPSLGGLRAGHSTWPSVSQQQAPRNSLVALVRDSRNLPHVTGRSTKHPLLAERRNHCPPRPRGLRLTEISLATIGCLPRAAADSAGERQCIDSGLMHARACGSRQMLSSGGF